jgi:hypothetical protein
MGTDELPWSALLFPLQTQVFHRPIILLATFFIPISYLPFDPKDGGDMFLQNTG